MQDPQVIQILEIVAPTAISVVFIISGAAVLYNWIDKQVNSAKPEKTYFDPRQAEHENLDAAIAKARQPA